MVRRASWPSAGLLLRLPGRSTEPIGIEHIWRAAGGMRRASPRHRDESRRPRRPGPTTTGSNHRHSCRRARWPVDCARDWRAGAAAASFSLRVDGGVDNVCTGRLGRAPSAEREYDRHQVGCAVGRAGGQSCDGDWANLSFGSNSPRRQLMLSCRPTSRSLDGQTSRP